ncbi:hypothetical protein HY497_02390 [Candidatus Woesearchaeota archaeon]|nr:hypothetical protein [Candidatus Woesearchaeota archaeon]
MASPLMYGIAFLILIVGGIFLLFRFAKHAVKWVLIAIGIMLIASAVFGINLFNDIKDLQKNFPKAQKLLLLNEDNMILAGFEGKLFSSDDVLSYISEEQRAAFQQHYSVRDLRGLRENYFKVIMFDTSAFEQMELSVSGNISANEALGIIRADNPIARTVTQVIRRDHLPDTPETRSFLTKGFREKGVSSDDDMRAFLFVLLFKAALEKDPWFLMNGFKSGSIIVYPETITFKLAKLVPMGVLKEALDKTMSGVNA